LDPEVVSELEVEEKDKEVGMWDEDHWSPELSRRRTNDGSPIEERSIGRDMRDELAWWMLSSSFPLHKQWTRSNISSTLPFDPESWLRKSIRLTSSLKLFLLIAEIRLALNKNPVTSPLCKNCCMMTAPNDCMIQRAKARPMPWPTEPGGVDEVPLAKAYEFWM
jgi:hypothetical protein